MIVPPVPISLAIGVVQLFVILVMPVLFGFPPGIRLPFGGAPPMIVRVRRVIVAAMHCAAGGEDRYRQGGGKSEIAQARI